MAATVLLSYAKQHGCDALSEITARLIQAIPYYNDRAKQQEIKKFTPVELLAKIKADPCSVIIARSGNQMAGFCPSRSNG